MRSAEVSQRFQRFFADREHTLVPSASLIADDPTLLLVPAGMVPFKPYFLGELQPPWKRAVSVQKCVRTVDIEEVGKTTRHNSFFEMCGNFSFGDYFKERAIPYAWELLTRSTSAGGFGFPEERLWATVYLDDDEAAQIWLRDVGLPEGRLQRRGKADNYWHMGVPGPGGPCSEIYYDRGPEHGREGGPVVDEERYLEVWNLVFMQYDLSSVRSKEDFDVSGALPSRNIDTGMGLERMATLLQGVDNLYEIDTTGGILRRAAELTGRRYGADARTDVALRVVADHVRTVVMLIGDGVTPGNEGRNYVLRRLLRRAVRNMRLLGAEEPVMHELTDHAVTVMGAAYPAMTADAARIDAVAVAEEASFLATLRTGTTLFDTAVTESRRTGGGTLSGERAFQLHDTFGFPIDLTLEMAGEAGLTVDEDGFRQLMEEQRRRAKADAAARKTGHTDLSAYRSVLDQSGPSVFTGYEQVAGEARVAGLLRGGAVVPAATAGDEVEVVLDRTPFYAEAGGQLADQGLLRLDGAELAVLDVQRPLPDLVVHRARVVTGELAGGSLIEARVDVERRKAISRAHTATHLVHTAVRRLVGDAATQAGSENAPGRLRFDFAAPSAVEPKLLADVEDQVNAVLTDDLEVRAFVTDQAQARRLGAMALFGEKYGDEVRVVEVGDYARELCGGTHALRSGQLGLVKILGESSIGAGVRRIEALVGLDAFRYLAREHLLVARLSEHLKAPAEELVDRVTATTTRLREAERALERLRAQLVLSAAAGLAAGAEDVFGVAVVAHEAPVGTGADDLRRLALDVRGRIDPGRPAVVAVGAVTADRPVLVIAVNDVGKQWGVKAGELVRAVAPVLGGGGGGKDDVAQGGGTRPAALGEALRQLTDLVGRRVTGSW